MDYQINQHFQTRVNCFRRSMSCKYGAIVKNFDVLSRFLRFRIKFSFIMLICSFKCRPSVPNNPYIHHNVMLIYIVFSDCQPTYITGRTRSKRT